MAVLARPIRNRVQQGREPASFASLWEIKGEPEMPQSGLCLPRWQVTRSLVLTTLALILVGLTPWQALAATHSHTRAQGTHAAATGSTVYVGSDDAALYAFNAKTGVLFWKYVTGGMVTSSPSSVVN